MSEIDDDSKRPRLKVGPGDEIQEKKSEQDIIAAPKTPKTVVDNEADSFKLQVQVIQEELFEEGDAIAPGTPIETFEALDSFNREVNQVMDKLKGRHPQVPLELLKSLSEAAVQGARDRQSQKIRTPEEARREYEESLSIYRGSLMLEGFSKGVMPLPVFYEDASRWVEVCGEEDYPLQEKALSILRRDVGKMLDIVTPEDSTNLRLYDFGGGIGLKGLILALEAVDKNGRHIEIHDVDSSKDMLYEWVSLMTKQIMYEVQAIKKNVKKRNRSKWKELALFLSKHDLNYSIHPKRVDKKIRKILYKYYEDPSSVDLIKHIFARMVSLELSDEKKRALIEKLDSEVKLPLTIHAHPSWFEDLERAEFEPAEQEGVAIFDLGSEVNNKFPGDSLNRFNRLLPEPQIPSDRVVPLNEEKKAKATYAVLGMELGEIPRGNKHFAKTRTRMRKSYNNSPFRGLTTDAFKKGDLIFIDSETKEEVYFDDIGFLYVDYEEDKNHPGYYMATHRFYITKDVEIYKKGDGEDNRLHVAGQERAQDLFERTVEALFDPARQKELKGIRKEVMTRLNVATKEELLGVGTNRFFSRDFSHYWSGMQIAETVTGEENKLEQTLLYPSYKPSLEQMVDLCHEKGLKVIEVYPDNEDNPTYVKILIRKMTIAEKALYASQKEAGNIDETIFYVPGKKEKQTKESNRKTRKEARRKARKAKRAETKRAGKKPATKKPDPSTGIQL